MMFRKILATFFLLTCLSFSAQGALITVEKANASFGSANIDLAAYWATLSEADISTDMIETATMLYNGSANNDTIFKMTINFYNSVDTLFSLFAGLDAGRGAEFYVNGNLVSDLNTNIWWGRNWAHSQVVAIEDIYLLANVANQVVVFWAENFNSGGNSFEFTMNGGQRLVLSEQNLPNPVPAPSTIALFGMALVGLSFARRNAKCIA